MKHYTMKHHTPSTVVASVLLALLSVCQSAHADTKVRTSSFEYNAQGLLVKEIVEPLTPNNCLQTSYTYDAFGNKTGVSTAACAGATAPVTNSATVARTAATSFGTDGRFPVTSTNALSQSETKVYDPRHGGITKLTGPNGLSTTWQYDNFGRKTRETRADATYTTWAYKLCTDTGANCPAAIGGKAIRWLVIEQSFAVNAAANAPEKRQYYDGINRIIRVQTQGFDGTTGVASPVLVQDTHYNDLGQVAKQSNLYALVGGTPVWSSFTYDQTGAVLTQSVPDASATGGIATTSFVYNGLTTKVTNAKGQTKTTTKNAQGQVALVTDSAGQTVAYTYDALGQLTQTNAAGSITTLQYNQRGQKVAMQDPAMGSWVYSYNAYGELVSQRDSLNQTTTMAYDVLGRMTNRTEPGLISDWSYDKNFAGVACGKSVGKLCEAKSNNGYNRKHTYDPLGRIVTSATVLDSATTPATVSETFDANTGRVSSKTWPTGYKANYSYTPLGYLKTVSAGGTTAFPQIVSHTILAMNAQGQVTQYKTGNNVTTVKNFAADTGRLNSQTATLGGQTAGNVLNQSYTYDSLGNLTSRADNAPGVGTSESYSYDSLNRLTTATLLGGAVSPPTTTQVMYDARGNIAYKSDVGRYWYDTARPNRMTQVTLETAPGATVPLTGTRALAYAFDDLRTGSQTIGSVRVGNGNLEYTVSRDTVNNVHTVRSETYTSYGMPLAITYGNFITSTTSTADRTLSFVYGPEHQRIKQNIALTGVGTSAYFAGNVWYLNGEDSLGLSYEKEIRANGTTENKHYVRAAGITFALFTSRTGTLNGLPATTTSYFHHDQLGSISAITNELGAVVERLAYDPWGKRRFINTTPGRTDKLDALVGIKTDRGFTEHEHLDEMGVIHMNGRIYDPLIGRFMSADPIIQAPDNLQSYNRYSYVFNNPLNLTDPTGFSAWTKFRDKVLKPVVIAVVSYYTGGAFGAMYNSAAAATTLAGGTAFTVGGLGISGTTALISGSVMGFTTGFAGSVVNGGNLEQSLKAGLLGGIGGSLTGGIQGAFGSSYPIERVLANTVAGGVQSRLQGGSFAAGARTSFKFSAAAYLNVQLNDIATEQSTQHNGNNDGTGRSRGLFGNGVKNGGGRDFIGADRSGSGSLLGGWQDGPGRIGSISYPIGGFTDMIVESFSGPHDYANSFTWYVTSPEQVLQGLGQIGDALPAGTYGSMNFLVELATNYSTSLVFAAPLAAGAIYEELNLGTRKRR